MTSAPKTIKYHGQLYKLARYPSKFTDAVDALALLLYDAKLVGQWESRDNIADLVAAAILKAPESGKQGEGPWGNLLLALAERLRLKDAKLATGPATPKLQAAAEKEWAKLPSKLQKLIQQAAQP